MTTTISIVIPIYNEAENIVGLILDITGKLNHLMPNSEIIVVDDGSTDNTIPVLTDLLKRVQHLRILHHQSNFGQTMALYNGIQAAKGQIIVTLDGDGQNDPNDICDMITLLENNRDENVQMIAGYRKKRNDNTIRIISSKVANKVRTFLLKDSTPDTGCGLKVFYREKFLLLPFFDHMHRFLPALIQRHGGKVISREVNHLPRKKGISKYGVWDRLWIGIVDLFGVVWLNRRMKRTTAEEITGERLNE